MEITSIQFRGHDCFKSHWSGFEQIKPINVIIGKNNAGKSRLLDLAHALTTWQLKDRDWDYKITTSLDEPSLKRAFPENYSGGDLVGNYWSANGKFLVGKAVCLTTDSKLQPTSELTFLPPLNPDAQPGGAYSHQKRMAILKAATHTLLWHKLAKKQFRRLLADRDLRSEVAHTVLKLSEDGRGATNIIRKFILTSNKDFPRELIQKDILGHLNTIFSSDGYFEEIQIKNHDENAPVSGDTQWEVFLGEAKKGLISLSNSGSGLKTVLLVLLNLYAIPHIEKKSFDQYVFAFEELENNLHPSLLRRLFGFLESFAVDHGATLFLTTHSSTALDLFGESKHAQIIHVTHDHESARAQTVSAHFGQLGILSEIGARPSDFLQANGIVWVEGPSDCIYFNRWIELISEGKLREGKDYQCAFYGGALLARTQFVTPEQAERNLVNLFRINPNIVVICDGDRGYPRARVKDRVRRIRAEVMNIPSAHIWISKGREVENYIPGEILAKVYERSSLPDLGQYDHFLPRRHASSKSYSEMHLNQKAIDKVELAIEATPQMTLELMKSRFDWKEQMESIREKIKTWSK